MAQCNGGVLFKSPGAISASLRCVVVLLVVVVVLLVVVLLLFLFLLVVFQSLQSCKVTDSFLYDFVLPSNHQHQQLPSSVLGGIHFWRTRRILN